MFSWPHGLSLWKSDIHDSHMAANTTAQSIELKADHVAGSIKCIRVPMLFCCLPDKLSVGKIDIWTEVLLCLVWPFFPVHLDVPDQNHFWQRYCC